MARSQTAKQAHARNHVPEKPVFYIPPNFTDLYHEILKDPSKVGEKITDSFLYDSKNFLHFSYMISEDPSKIPKALEEVDSYASDVEKLISENTVGLKGNGFQRFGEFANVLKFYIKKIGDIREMASKYKKGGDSKEIATSLSSIKFLLTQLENDVTEFLPSSKKPKKRKSH